MGRSPPLLPVYLRSKTPAFWLTVGRELLPLLSAPTMSGSPPDRLATLEGLASGHSQGCCPVVPELSQGPGCLGRENSEGPLTLKLAPSFYSLPGRWWWQSSYQRRGDGGREGGFFSQERGLSAGRRRAIPHHLPPPKAEWRTGRRGPKSAPQPLLSRGCSSPCWAPGILPLPLPSALLTCSRTGTGKKRLYCVTSSFVPHLPMQ